MRPARTPSRAVAGRQRLSVHGSRDPSSAAALGLVPWFTPVYSRESNGVSEAFVKTLKRNYARMQPRPNADTVLACLGIGIGEYNEHLPPRARQALAPRVHPCSNPTCLVSGDGGNSRGPPGEWRAHDALGYPGRQGPLTASVAETLVAARKQPKLARHQATRLDCGGRVAFLQKR